MNEVFDLKAALINLNHFYYADEDSRVKALIPDAQLNSEARSRVAAHARQLISEIREHHKPQLSATDLLTRFGLTSQEGVALMCLAEALLRIPDSRTADALIRDKLHETHWNDVLGTDAPWTINAMGWALSLTGKVVNLDDDNPEKPGKILGRLVSRVGQPIVREAIRHAMQWLADRFVMGQTIEQALQRASQDMSKGIRFSFDMLGEGARTSQDAWRYFQDYKVAIESVGRFQQTHQFSRPSGISVKLSALHPRYEMSQRDRVFDEMLPMLTELCEVAAGYDLPLTIDAEEADRLHLSLEIARCLFQNPKFDAWSGLGFAVQAYQKRAPFVIDALAGMAKVYKKRVHLRLVKGAYWDTEVKRAQERGLEDFPVFTRKENTDISYLACARRMFSYQDVITPVFGTHNALTVSYIKEFSGSCHHYEFQRLHGMGEELHERLHQEGSGCCVYAPVGNHDVLLGYLVRRILENGANSSFVHRLLDRKVPIEELVQDPIDVLYSYSTVRHPLIKRAQDLYQPSRLNSVGLDLSDPFITNSLVSNIRQYSLNHYSTASIISGRSEDDLSIERQMEKVFDDARNGFEAWRKTDVSQRADCLLTLANSLEEHRTELVALLVQEGGKTIGDALGEVREAVDFCRYYAQRANLEFQPEELCGPTGERNVIQLLGRGVFVCISPWNFPLAIFLGQISAALVAGNSVIAKPAPQTPRVAIFVSKLIYQSGIPANVFHLVVGGPEVGAALVRHGGVSGVAFTGSTAAARNINQSLAARTGAIVPLIAETGGQNAMLVDSSALPEQVVDDVVLSSFRSCGQRCSALRLLCLPEATADKILSMLMGAMAELRMGDPWQLETDIGPVIDEAAFVRLQTHISRLTQEAKKIYAVPLRGNMKGYYVAPQVWEISTVSWLREEVFGPILHVIRYTPDNLGTLIQQINATGFGLTGGLHSRIEATVHKVQTELKVGNLYINRSIIGAVVGVQPFGGQGLSGTGPKAGGPRYLQRFAVEHVTSINTTAAGGNASLLAAMAG